MNTQKDSSYYWVKFGILMVFVAIIVGFFGFINSNLLLNDFTKWVISVGGFVVFGVFMIVKYVFNRVHIW